VLKAFPFDGNSHVTKATRYLDVLAFLLAQITFILAESLALAAALIFLLAFLARFTGDFRPLTFAHLALAAAEIFALPAALIFHFLFGTARTADLVEEPNNWPSFFTSDWIFSFNTAALRNC
jgi:Zn-dependent protease